MIEIFSLGLDFTKVLVAKVRFSNLWLWLDQCKFIFTEFCFQSKSFRDITWSEAGIKFNFHCPPDMCTAAVSIIWILCFVSSDDPSCLSDGSRPDSNGTPVWILYQVVPSGTRCRYQSGRTYPSRGLYTRLSHGSPPSIQIQTKINPQGCRKGLRDTSYCLFFGGCQVSGGKQFIIISLRDGRWDAH